MNVKTNICPIHNIEVNEGQECRHCANITGTDTEFILRCRIKQLEDELKAYRKSP